MEVTGAAFERPGRMFQACLGHMPWLTKPLVPESELMWYCPQGHMPHGCTCAFCFWRFYFILFYPILFETGFNVLQSNLELSV